MSKKHQITQSSPLPANIASHPTTKPRGVLATALRPLTRSLDQLMEEADFRGKNFQVKVTLGKTEVRMTLDQPTKDQGKHFRLEVEDLPQ